MEIQEAIKLAIENGYSLEDLADRLGVKNRSKVEVGNKYVYVLSIQCNRKQLCGFETIFLDPQFWKALGKGLGWGMEMFHEDNGKTYWDYFEHCPVCGEALVWVDLECPNECETENPSIISWQYNWHSLIDHLAEGGEIKTFFKELK